MRDRTKFSPVVSLLSSAALIGACLAALSACVEKGPGGKRKEIDPSYIKNNILTEAPTTLTNTINADLDGKIVYLGNVIEKTAIAPGDKVMIKHYWKVVQAPGTQWHVFSHLKGEGHGPDFLNVDETDMRTGHGPATWQAGEIIQDIQQFTLSPNWHSKTATLIVGLFPTGKHGIGDRMKIVSGPNADGAVIAATFTVDTSKAPPAPGTVIVKQASSPIVIDGVADEPAWATAAASGDFVQADGSPAPVGKASAKMTWDDKNLYVFATISDPDVFSQFSKDDDTLWKNDDLEMFIDADGNGHGYVELQVNPNNAHFDSWFATTRAQPGDVTWNSNMVSKVVVHGTADNRDDTDQGWDVEIAIPWAAVKGRDDAMKVNTPPAIGDKFRLNVVRVDLPKDQTNPSASSWNKISYSDFHALDKMLTVVFADSTGKTTAVAPAVAPDSGAVSAPAAGVTIKAEPPAGSKAAPTTVKVTPPPGTPAAAVKVTPPAAGATAH